MTSAFVNPALVPYDDYTTSGNAPYPPQRIITLTVRSKATSDDDSHFGPDPNRGVIFPGGVAVFRIDGIDEYDPTMFSKTGMVHTMPVRYTCLGIPTSSVTQFISDPAQLDKAVRSWLGKRIRFMGITTNGVQNYAHGSPVITLVSGGAHDVLIGHYNVKIGDIIAWDIPTKRQIEAFRQNGTMLQQQNPGGLLLVPLKEIMSQLSFGMLLEETLHPINYTDRKALVDGTSGSIAEESTVRIDQYERCFDFEKEMREICEEAKKITNLDSAQFRKLLMDHADKLCTLMNEHADELRARTAGRVLLAAPGGNAAYVKLGNV